MKRFAPYASLVIATIVTGCGGFTSLGDGAGAAGMGNASGSGMGDTGGGTASGGTGMSTGGTGMDTGGTGMSTGGTGMGTGGTGMSTGGTGMGTGGTGMGGYQSCAGKACGAGCTLCDPNDKTCVEGKSLKYCDDSGACGTSVPMCGGTTECTTRMDCPPSPGVCEICADGTSACSTVDCVSGKCVTTFPTCSVTECMSDGECPVSKAPCQMCADGTTACPWARCDGGKCTSGIDSCGQTYPCKGKSCGDTCSTCTGDGACPSVVMTCDENLQCQFNQPQCGVPQCKLDTDCNTDICGLCASTGGCADQVCVEGKCTFSCPPPKMDLCGGCLAAEVCVDQIGGPPGGQGYRCVQPPLCPNMNPCLCVQGEGTCTYHSDAGGWCECDNGLD
jgi:hypothetical protein